MTTADQDAVLRSLDFFTFCQGRKKTLSVRMISRSRFLGTASERGETVDAAENEIDCESSAEAANCDDASDPEPDREAPDASDNCGASDIDAEQHLPPAAELAPSLQDPVLKRMADDGAPLAPHPKRHRLVNKRAPPPWDRLPAGFRVACLKEAASSRLSRELAAQGMSFFPLVCFGGVVYHYFELLYMCIKSYICIRSKPQQQHIDWDHTNPPHPHHAPFNTIKVSVLGVQMY